MRPGQLDAVDLIDARQFQIVVKRLADSLSYGTDRSPFLGSGLEYVQSRTYLPGDPVRAIDWRVTARTGKVHVKEHESPKRMPVYLLIDTSASMVISSIQRSKYATALHIAGGIAMAALDRVSPVGVLGVGDESIVINPSLSKTQVMQWLMKLRRFRYDEGTHLADRIKELMPSLRQRALLFALTDLHDPASRKALERLAQRHDCAVIQLRDPAEDDLRGAGLIRAREAETGAEFWTHGRRQHLDQQAVQNGLRQSGIDHLLLRTDQSYLHSLRHFLETRGLLGRTAR